MPSYKNYQKNQQLTLLYAIFRGSNPLKILRETTAPAWDRSPRPPRSCKSRNGKTYFSQYEG